MEKDERLLPLPNVNDLQISQQDGAAGYSPFYDDDSVKEGRSIREYFLVVYKRLPLILALTILATAMTAFYMYRQPSIYEAQTTMIIEPRKQKVTQKDAININFGGDANYYNTQLKLLQNPDLMRDVVVRLGLHRDANLFNQQNKGVISSLKSMLTGDKSSQNKESSLPVLTEAPTEASTSKVALTPEEKERADMYAGILVGSLGVEQLPGTNLVNIKIQSTNPELAPKVADMVAQVFIDNDYSRETQGQNQTLEELTKSIKELTDTINAQEQERLNYMQNTGIPLQSEGEKVASARISQLSSQWLEAEDDRRKVQAAYEAAVDASRKGSVLPVIVDDKAIQDAQAQALKRKAELEQRIEKMDTQIQDAETERAALLVKYTPEYPKVKEIEKKIQSMKENREKTQAQVSKQIETESIQLEEGAKKKVLTGLEANLAAAKKREAQAYDLYTKELASANQSGVAATRLTTLTSNIETNRSLLNTYTQRQKEMQLTMSSSKPDNLSISSYAGKTANLIGPNRNRNIIIAFLVSLAAGIGLAFLFDYLDDSIKSSDDVGRHLGLPTLALIPHHNTIKKQKRPNTALATRNGFSSMALISLEDTRSAMAEAYRHLRTSLLFSSAGKPPQTILVTSSQPSEGKTTTAINTAVTLAQSGADVVIIDCDLRRPRLHSHFDLENTTGLTNYLSGDRNPDNLLKPFPGLPNLKVVTSGPIPPNPAELLSSNEMKSLLQFLKGNFKHVVIDSPPAISFTDAAILSTLVDGVVLVAMSGKSSIHLMRRFKQRLSAIGARIYGVVLNGIKPNTLEYGYYGYGYTYSYYDAPEDDATPRMEEEAAAQAAKN
jgi:polysaccharide biosynthesis transport protein